jgi:hypothetical protein
MKIYSVTIEDFRSIRCAKPVLPDHAVLIGDNNTGRSSVFEAIDLALGPDRPSRRPPVGEHASGETPDNLEMGPPVSGVECGSAHIGGAKSIRLDDGRQPRRSVSAVRNWAALVAHGL